MTAINGCVSLGITMSSVGIRPTVSIPQMADANSPSMRMFARDDLIVF